MIEITSRLVREQTPVFLCGEMVECFISFKNPPLPEHRISQSNNDILENLAWATAQIQCYCNSTIYDKNDKLEINTPTTSLNGANQGHGEIVMSTSPKILFCDMRLAPGETKSYWYREGLPNSSPPTYRGTNIKYYYKLTIATQRVGSTVQALQVPIRVLPLPAVNKTDDVPVLCNETNEELAPSNPFLEKSKTESKLEMALHHLQNVTARRRPNFYSISNKRGKVGRFCLFKSAYKLGEDIVGSLDFTDSTVRCVQLSVTLQCEEQILKNNMVEPDEKIMNFTKHHEVCLGLKQTQMILPIPLYVTPTFSTDIVCIKWRLHFEFVTSINENLMQTNVGEETWQAPTDINIETMIWNHPITLYPTSPLQISHASGKYSLLIK